jgi:hypothetical protein
VVQEIRIPERRSALEKIAQGLSVASSIMGIKSQWEQSKVNELKMKEYEAEKEAAKRRQVGEFTESEVANLYKVQPGTKGSSIGYVQQMERTPQGKVIYNEETGQPKTSLKPFHYINKDAAQIQSYLDKQTESTAKVNELNIRARGGVPISDITTGKVKNWSLKPTEGTVKSFYIDPNTTEEVPIWVSPEVSRSVKTGGEFGKSVAPDWAKKNADMLAGWTAARESGIDNPTPQQALENDPKFLNKKLTEYQNVIKEDDTNFLAALDKFDRDIGIDYAVKDGQIFNDKKQNISGVTDAGGYVPTSGVFGVLGRTVLSPEATRNQGTIAGIVNLLLQKRSGAAISPQEAARLAAELNTAVGNNDAAGIRRAVAEIREKTKAYYETKSLTLPPSARKKLKENPSIPSPYSGLFKAKENLSDENAADVFMGGQ